jgi:hypothetical protein
MSLSARSALFFACCAHTGRGEREVVVAPDTHIKLLIE